MQSNNVFKLIASDKEITHFACKKCGYAGHLTYQCRNFIKVDPGKEIVLDVSTTSSDSDNDYMSPLKELQEKELNEKFQQKEKKKRDKDKKKKHKKKNRYRAESRSTSESKGRKMQTDKYKKQKNVLE